MSILDALRVQKANQQSVSQLAMLPQKEIIRLAQMGHIPADVVPVVINEKARMAQEAAQLQASAQMQQGQPPTVIEQAMQANAQAEMPEAGVATLPTDGMFQGQNFQAGGIVAFEDGGRVSDMPSKELVRAFSNVQRDKTSGKDIEVLMAGLGIDEGMLGVNVAKLSDSQREDLASNLVAQYGTRFGDLGVQGQVIRPLNAPPGVYSMGAGVSYPVGPGRLSAGLDALRTPERTSLMGYNLGYGAQAGPGQLSAGVSVPKYGRPQGQIQYRMPFAEGGVVAFNGEDGSFVEGPTGLRMLREEAAPKRGKLPSLAESIAEAQRMAAPYFAESPEEAALKQARSKGILSKEDMDRQMYMRLAEAGLGIMAGQSPYAFSNIGAGALPALKGYAEDVKAQKAMQLEGLKGAAEAARAKRLEGLKTVELGSQIYGKELENVYRMASLDRNTDFQRRVKNFTPRAMAELGTDDPNDPRVIDLATHMADASAGFASGRVQSREDIEAASRALQEQLNTYSRRIQAENSWNFLKSIDPRKREYNRLFKEDPDAAQAIKDKYIDDLMSRQPSAAPRPAPTPAAAPNRPSSGAPSAAPASGSSQYKIGDTFVVQSGPHKGKTAEWDGTGFKLKD